MTKIQKKVTKTKAGKEYITYQLNLPKAIVEGLNLSEKEVNVILDGKKIILCPLEPSQ